MVNAIIMHSFIDRQPLHVLCILRRKKRIGGEMGGQAVFSYSQYPSTPSLNATKDLVHMLIHVIVHVVEASMT